MVSTRRSVSADDSSDSEVSARQAGGATGRRRTRRQTDSIIDPIREDDAELLLEDPMQAVNNRGERPLRPPSCVHVFNSCACR